MKFAILLASVLVSVSSVGKAEDQAIIDIALQKVEAGALLIDVRSPDEYAAGHLDGAVNIPHDQVLPLSWFIKDKQRDVVLYCGSGKRAGKAAKGLEELGFVAIYNGTGYKALLTAQQ